ncbi:hypothetical protein [Streptosporangium amethystogenes]|uniref:hypothetical protein n=1 Tax=Streptosporangium amethystogenes TaxID=2002 RepID=UPI0004CACA79|nr:hypothetical protein [Streptosporangium amethystogenes]
MRFRRRGPAGEAVVALVDRLRARGTAVVASSAVARGAGPAPTGGRVDGEVVWRHGGREPE